MHDSRTSDRTPLHYTMKTPARHSPAATGAQSHSRSNSNSYTISHPHSQSLRSSKQPKSSTPIASPRMPYSVGQNHPPKLSPRGAPDARAASPNYFGLIVEPGSDRGESSALPKDNWSPSSSVKSFGAAIPKQVPLDANPDFEAFKRQADLNRGKSIALSTNHYATPSVPSAGGAPVRPRPPRWHTHGSDTGGESIFSRGLSSANIRPASRMDLDQDSLQDSAYVSSDSKRNSESSMNNHTPTLNLPRFESPRPMDPSQHRTNLTKAEDRDPRLSLMEHRPDRPSPQVRDIQRAETVPTTLEPGHPHMITGEQLRDMLRNVKTERLLLLDIRSSQNYAQARIQGALNLCIPTTLLKRATFNIQKLQQTFQGGSASSKFSNWREMDYIVVYDAHSFDKRDAVTAQNMIKKFTNEGFSGGTCILKGGYNSFHEQYPDLVDRQSASGSPGKPGAGPGAIAPVIGGVMLPTASNDVNPFFSNIRQNMDLADGVGQLDVSRPSALDSPSLPRWLREAASKPDHGKQVSDKFLNIEVDEQSRMKAAYAAFNPHNKDKRTQVQLCGVEKGVKNRYKDILPFEHARVKLLEKSEGSCDYINASHLQASRSNKRYIATQGPLPATFEDFWSVIWEQDVRVVVMLTAESEGGQLKCHPYWKGRDFGAMRLKTLSEKKVSLDIDKHRPDSHHTPSTSIGEQVRKRANTTTTLDSTQSPKPTQGQTDIPYVIIRKFALSHNANPFEPIREITHLHFPSWPDFGTPAQPSHLLALVELANVMQRSALPVETASVVGSPTEQPPITWYDEPEVDSRARPMLVHCSAGCGRTGTFCTVDSVLDMLKRQRQAKLDAVRSRDHEGDVLMGESMEASPRANKHFNFYTPGQRSNMERKVARGAAAIDASWLHDDSIDLIQKTVEDFREQRLSMVQSLRQYVLCYETVLEWVTRMNERGVTAPNGRARSGSLQQPHH
ncbi:hypothetical protein FZEAL_10327 [Fusarium zealandicum]|uniref:protein-tyrosine-phosphatase n=1 Tax=Fusarium zealandicum TaxID=1053134 RepID=A0A8H4U3P4_9HYPO|nr:hypothetical protein FZEAL_10327 [Fusarium zealandicum]